MSQNVLHFVAADDFELPELPGRALPSRSYTETYYDTAGGRLDRAGFVLRRRVENGKGIWHLTVTSDGDSALVAVTDNGPGVPGRATGSLRLTSKHSVGRPSRRPSCRSSSRLRRPALPSRRSRS